MHKFYYTYKITLLKGSLTGHYYFGRHKTNNLNDGYAGSGRKLKDYYKKYDAIEGVTYVKSILQFYNSDEELNEAEKFLINDKYITDPLCLNLCEGGTCGCLSDESIEKIKLHHKDVSGTKNPMFGLTGENNPNFGSKRDEETKRLMSESPKGKQVWWIGRQHSEETKKLQREHYVGNKGMKWKKDPNTGKRIYYKNINN